MMKKKLALVLAMAMTASLALTGCGNGDADFFGGNSAGKACEHEGGGKLLHLHDFFSMGGVEPH